MLQGAILTYSEEAAIKAKEEGEQIGVVKGRKEGEQIGVVKGREEVARELLSEGMDLRMVARVAKLPEDTVARLKAGLNK